MFEFSLVILIKCVVRSLQSNKQKSQARGNNSCTEIQSSGGAKCGEGNIKKIQFKVGCMNLESCATLLKTQQTS